MPAIISGKATSLEQHHEEWLRDLCTGLQTAVLECGAMNLAENDVFPLIGRESILPGRKVMLIRVEKRMARHIELERALALKMVKAIGMVATQACPDGWSVHVFIGSELCVFTASWSGTNIKGEVRCQTGISSS